MNKSTKRNKLRKHNKKIKHNKTIKHKKLLLGSKNNAYGLISNSYSPTINKDLVTLKSIPRKELLECNMEEAFNLKEPLKIGIPGNLYGKNCYYYYTPQAKKFLLKNLSADKHIDPKKIIPPIQNPIDVVYGDTAPQPTYLDYLKAANKK